MTLSRRDLAILAASAALAPGAALAQMARAPIVIAHRGASGERPEHTRAAYELAIAQGADFIEPDLVLTKDGVLVVRHENEISATTDVASRPQFADRRATKTVDGVEVTGWFSEDFTLAEIKTLLTRERMPRLRPQSARFDGKEPVLTFQEVIDIARAASVRTGRVIGLYPEMKHPAYFAGLDMEIEPRVATVIRTNGYSSPAAAMFVQCFEPEPLKAFGRLARTRRIQLISPDPRYASMLTPEGLAEIKTYAGGVGVEQSLVLDLDAEPFPVARRLTANAHAAGLLVHSWTARPENEFMPPRLRRGDPRSRDYKSQRGEFKGLVISLFVAGVDGVFSDFPGLAVAARTEAQRLTDRQRR